MSDLPPGAKAEMALIGARERITELERVFKKVNSLLAEIEHARPFSLMLREYRAEMERLAREGLKALASVEPPTPQEESENA